MEISPVKAIPKIAIPMHYDSIVGDASDAEKFSNALEGKIRVEILKHP